MNDVISIFKNDLYNFIDHLNIDKNIKHIKKQNVSIDFFSKSRLGDLSTNLLILSKYRDVNHFDIKSYVFNFLTKLPYVGNVEIAKAGFINITFSKKYLINYFEYYYNLSLPIIDNTIIKKDINIEFVSANPTGPIHLAHLRGAVLGDVISSILEAVGHKVTREFYVNDAGSQIKTLGSSLFKRYQEKFNIKVVFSEGEYPGDYVKNIANEILVKDGNKWLNEKNVNKRSVYFEKFAVNRLIDDIKNDLSLININFDLFSYESQIVENKYIDKVFEILKYKELLYEGVLDKPLGDDSEWEPRKQLLFRSTNFADDSDRAFQKEEGDWTYFANDSAYHYNKYSRNFDQLINIWGADHIGYINRMKSIVEVFSNKKNYLEVFVCQIVRLIKNSQILKMSKRDGNFITLKSIHGEVGTDPLRYFMVSSKSESPMDLDMDKIIEKNKDNPVFYCQYAYARASSVIRKSKDIKNLPEINKSLTLLSEKFLSEYEWSLIWKIYSWPYVLKQTSVTMQPHRITNYLEDLCSQFHIFWNKGKDDETLRMLDENNLDKTLSKLLWIELFRKTLKQAFDIIGIDAPEIM